MNQSSGGAVSAKRRGEWLSQVSSDASDSRASAHVGTEPVSSITRAARLPLCVAVEYRDSASATWRTGRTINVSCSGVLFETDEPPTDGVLEFVLRLARGPDTGLQDVRCHGRWVRAENRRDGSWAVAATINRYEYATTE